MKRYTGGGVVFESRESANIKSELQAFQGKVNAGAVTVEDCDKMIELFTGLQNAAKTYRSNAGNKAMLGQIMYWIDTWDDVTRGAIAELQALKADLAGDSSKMLSKYSEGSGCPGRFAQAWFPLRRPHRVCNGWQRLHHADDQRA